MKRCECEEIKVLTAAVEVLAMVSNSHPDQKGKLVAAVDALSAKIAETSGR